jgi:hypothetical protein
MGKSGRTGPSRAWYVLPGLLLLAALTLAGFGLSSFVHFVRSDLRFYQPESSISVTSDGFTLYTEDGAATRAADVRCTAVGPAGAVSLRPISGRVAWSNNAGTFVAIASTPRDVPPGRYVIQCSTEMTGSDLPLYVGPRLDLAAVGQLVAFGIVAPLFLGVCAAVLFAILAILRYRAHRRAISALTPTA